MSISISPLPAFQDNYLWLISHLNKQAVIVDPGDPYVVTDALAEKELELIAILITHHHHDHIGGIEKLVSQYNVPVYGPDSKRIPQITHHLYEGNQITLFDDDEPLLLEVMETPGHTLDHISYINRESSLLFCGDTLFSAGCGRLYDGTHEQLMNSLKRLNQLPADTRVFCTHEYTLANLDFALHVEPDNKAIRQYIDDVSTLRKRHQASLPTTIAIEQQINPFMRFSEPGIAHAIREHWQEKLATELELFSGLRRWKDHF